MTIVRLASVSISPASCDVRKIVTFLFLIKVFDHLSYMLFSNYIKPDCWLVEKNNLWFVE